MKKFLLLIIASVLMSMPIYAFGPEESIQTRDFYFSVGLGSSANRYDDKSLDFNDADKISLFLDLGFYVPTNQNMLFGGVINVATDRFTDKYNDNNYYQINTFILGGSALYFLESIEKGLFLRGDIGFAGLKVESEINGIKSSDKSEWGLGLLGGVGYSIPLESLSLTGSLLFSHKAIPRDLDVSTVSLSVGFLF